MKNISGLWQYDAEHPEYRVWGLGSLSDFEAMGVLTRDFTENSITIELFEDYTGGPIQKIFALTYSPPSGAAPAAAGNDDDDDDDEELDVVIVVVVISIVSAGAVVSVIVVLIKKGVIDISKLKPKR